MTNLLEKEQVVERQGGRSASRRPLLVEAGIVGALMLMALIVLPPLLTGMGQTVRINMLGRFMAMAIAALGIDLIWGYTGILSLGHGLFFALGGYAIAMHLNLQLPTGQLPTFFSNYGVTQLPFFWQPFYSLPLTMMAILVIPAAIAGGLGYLVFRNRLKGVYFSILTQAAVIVFYNFFNGQQKLINGTNGLQTDTTTFFGQPVGVPGGMVQVLFYSLTVVFLAGAYALCRWLTSGRLGKLLVAIRDDESRVRFSGYDPTSFKVLVFAISAGLAGIGGALYTVQTGNISPKMMDIAASIEMVIWVAVGGRGTLVGAVLGAVFVNFAKSLLSEQFPDIWLFFQGALFLLVVTVLPGGFVGWFAGAKPWLLGLLGRNRLSTYPQLAVDPAAGYERQVLDEQSAEANRDE
jgi:urea transport system permease protein